MSSKLLPSHGTRNDSQKDDNHKLLTCVLFSLEMVVKRGDNHKLLTCVISSLEMVVKRRDNHKLLTCALPWI